MIDMKTEKSEEECTLEKLENDAIAILHQTAKELLGLCSKYGLDSIYFDPRVALTFSLNNKSMTISDSSCSREDVAEFRRC